jgi:phosphoglycerate kinase
MLSKLSVRDLEVAGKKVFVRVDFNVPLNDRQEVTDDTRIRASLDTLRLLLERGAILVLGSHLGRPDGKVMPAYSLSPVADRLAELIDAPVHFARDCVGREVQETVAQLRKGSVLMLENLRFHAGEEANSPEFAAELAALADLYVNDAFGTAHRAHASTEGMTRHFEFRAAGLLMERELTYLGQLLSDPERPACALLGGAKLGTKIPVIRNLLEHLDTLMIGGGMAFTFFKALGLGVGKSLLDASMLDTALKTIRSAKESKREILLPVDIVIAREITDDAETQIVLPTDIPEGWMGLDIGPKTVELYTTVIQASKSIFWNGPMGVFEVPKFSRGTLSLAKALAEATSQGAITVVGGGDSVAAVTQLKLAKRFTHVSTGGGASLEFMEGKALPGVEALSDAKEAVV